MGGGNQRNVSRIVCPLWCVNPELTEALEAYRLAFEADYGPTDLNKTYSTQLPDWRQELFLRHDARTYVKQMPPYLCAFLYQTLRERDGPLDDMTEFEILLSAAFATLGRRAHDENKGR